MAMVRDVRSIYQICLLEMHQTIEKSVPEFVGTNMDTDTNVQIKHEERSNLFMYMNDAILNKMNGL